MDWLLQSLATSFLAWLGIGGLIAVGALVLGYFFPPIRRIAIEVAVAILTVGLIYAKGRREGSVAKQKEWDDAEAKSVQRGKDARTAAESEPAPDELRDPLNRDNKRGAV
jgi:hypothetical protein